MQIIIIKNKGETYSAYSLEIIMCVGVHTSVGNLPHWLFFPLAQIDHSVGPQEREWEILPLAGVYDRDREHDCLGLLPLIVTIEYMSYHLAVLVYVELYDLRLAVFQL